MAENVNILFITIDSLRYDHTSLSNQESTTTPNLEQIAESDDGVSFDSCIAHSEWTRSSVGTILSGLYPENHMVGMQQDRSLSDEISTVAERLSSVGYRTACLSSNPLIGPELGLTNGFDRVERIKPTLNACLKGLRQYPYVYGEFLARLNTHSVGFTRKLPHSKDFLTARIAQRWLEQFMSEDEPFFLYLHLNEPHRPYNPAREFLDSFVGDINMSPTEARDCSLDIDDNLYEIIANGCKLDEEQWHALQAMYRSEIAYTDKQVGELFDFVTKHLDDTITVITSDHGELFGEHDLLAHKLVLDDAIVHVPLVIHGLQSVENQQGNIVQHLDVVKTILDHAGANTEYVQGYNLNDENREYAFSQRGEMGYARDIEEFKSYNPEFDSSRYYDGVLTSVRNKGHKLLHGSSKTGLVELTDETKDISDQKQNLKERMESVLVEWREDNIGDFGSSFTDSRDEIKNQLKSLGYLT